MTETKDLIKGIEGIIKKSMFYHRPDFNYLSEQEDGDVHIAATKIADSLVVDEKKVKRMISSFCVREDGHRYFNCAKLARELKQRDILKVLLKVNLGGNHV